MASKLFALLVFYALSYVPVTTADDLAPLFVGTDLNSGEEVALKSYRGKIVLLDFWASWCPPCLASLPAYDELRAELGTAEFDVISVNVDANTQDAVDFLEERPVTFPVIIDPDGEIGIPYRIRTLPRAFLLDREGRIITTFSSFNENDKERLRQQIISLINQP